MHGKDAAGPTATHHRKEMGTLLSQHHCSQGSELRLMAYITGSYRYIHIGTRVGQGWCFIRDSEFSGFCGFNLFEHSFL